MIITSAPSSSLIICAVPRSGSSLLAELLYSSGAVGYPAEWFWRLERERLWTEWGAGSHLDYLRRVLAAGTARSGVFAVKLQPGDVDDCLLYARALTRDYEASELATISAVFGEPSFVWVRRLDSVAQAVSWLKAQQTGQFGADQELRGEATYDFAEIDWRVHQVRMYDDAWRRWFKQHELAPAIVVYENLAADPAGVAGALLARFGLTPEKEIAVPPRLRKQADATNADWIARYFAEAERVSPGS